MIRRMIGIATIMGTLLVAAGLPSTATAHWRYRTDYWHPSPYMAGPPIVLRGSYYPARFYFPVPYYYGYDPYWQPYYGF